MIPSRLFCLLQKNKLKFICMKILLLEFVQPRKLEHIFHTSKKEKAYLRVTEVHLP